MADESTCTETHWYNADTEELTVTFASGGTYVYAGVPAEVAQGLVSAPSKGKFMHANILKAYSFRKG